MIAARSQRPFRHGRACPGHPCGAAAGRMKVSRLSPLTAAFDLSTAHSWSATWMAGTCPAMTREGRSHDRVNAENRFEDIREIVQVAWSTKEPCGNLRLVP
jgi:hypothetical protein